MGYYLNPPMKATQGRKLDGIEFSTLENQLNEGEILIGLYDRGIFKNAVHLYSEAEYNEFERQNIYRIGFYACPREWVYDK